MKEDLILAVVVLAAIFAAVAQWRFTRTATKLIAQKGESKSANGSVSEVRPRFVRHTQDTSGTVYRVLGPGRLKGFLSVVDGTDGGEAQSFAEHHVVDVYGFDPATTKIARAVAREPLRFFSGAEHDDSSDDGEVAPPPAGAKPEDQS